MGSGIYLINPHWRLPACCWKEKKLVQCGKWDKGGRRKAKVMKIVFFKKKKKGQLTGNIQVLLAMTRVHAANWLRNDALVLLHFSLSPTRITKATQGQKQPCKTLKQSYKQMENQMYASPPPPHPHTHWCGERKKPAGLRWQPDRKKSQ